MTCFKYFTFCFSKFIPIVLSHFSHVWLFATVWATAHQASLSMGFSRQESWSGLPCPSPGDLPNLGIEPVSLRSPALAGKFLLLAPPGEPDPSQIIPKNRRGRNTSKLILWSQYYYSDGFPGGTVVKNLPAKGLITGLGRFPWVKNGNPLSILAWKILWP